MPHCIRVLNTLLSWRVKWSETVLNILTVLPSIPFTAYWMMTCLSLKNIISLDRTYEICRTRNKIGRKKGLSQEYIFAHRSAVIQYQMKPILHFTYIHLDSLLRAIFFHQIYRLDPRYVREMSDVLRLLYASRLQVILSSGCFTIAAVGQKNLRSGPQFHRNRVFLVQHQLKFWLFQVQNAWGKIITMQWFSQMWCQEPHQWLPWTELHCCNLLEVTATALPSIVTGLSQRASFQTWQPWPPAAAVLATPGKCWLSQLPFLTFPPAMPPCTVLHLKELSMDPNSRSKSQWSPSDPFHFSGKHNFIKKTFLGGTFSS